MPASDNTLLLFLTHLHSKKLAFKSCMVYLSAVKSLHVLNNMAPPNLSNLRLKLALRAIQRQSPEPISKLPITFNVIQAIWKLLTMSQNEWLLKWVLALAFFGGLRGAEYLSSATSTGPKVKQITFTKVDGSITMNYQVPKSKTKNHGFTIPFKCSCNKICPLCSMQKYLLIRYQNHDLAHDDHLFKLNKGCIWLNH